MKVWYVSYGSNMNYERFMCYILGGKTELMSREEIGCTNKNIPTKHDLISLEHKLRFIESSKRWSNGGVAVISNQISNNSTIYGVKYLIDDDQFIDIIKQENNIDLDSKINISLEELKKGVSKKVFSNKRYSHIIYLGKIEGYNAFTFTCSDKRFETSPNKPSESYLKAILSGVYNLIGDKLLFLNYVDRLLFVDGIKGNYCKEKILALLF